MKNQGNCHLRESATSIPVQCAPMKTVGLVLRLRSVANRFLIALLASSVFLSGCAAIAGKAGKGVSRSLSAGVLNQDDPQLVREGLSAYLLLLGGLLDGDPHNADLLLGASKLYGAYAGTLASTDQVRRKRLALKAEDYARRAACVSVPSLCAVLDKPFDQFEPAVAQIDAKQVDVLYTLAGAWAGVLQADTSDWDHIADLPKVQVLFGRVRDLAPDYDHGSTFMYLGVLDCLRPESLGGNPKQGSEEFEQAIVRSQGKNQMARVLYAEYCARLVFDQPLHDRLLTEALAADPVVPGLTLINTLAQLRAKELQISGKDYF
jgi:TRAP transporter T-component